MKYLHDIILGFKVNPIYFFFLILETPLLISGAVIMANQLELIWLPEAILLFHVCLTISLFLNLDIRRKNGN